MDSSPSTSPDLLPGLGGQMQHPEVLVVVKLLSIRRGKLPTEDPQLPTTLGHHHGLLRERWWVRAQPDSFRSNWRPAPSHSVPSPPPSLKGLPLWFCLRPRTHRLHGTMQDCLGRQSHKVIGGQWPMEPLPGELLPGVPPTQGGHSCGDSLNLAAFM